MLLFNTKDQTFESVKDPTPEGCYLVDEEQINAISASLTGNGKVWVENGELKWTGKAPSQSHAWNGAEWVISEEKQAELLNAMRQQLTDNIDRIASELISKWTRFESEYKEREKAALVFKENQYQGEPSIYIKGFADAANIDNKTATDIILKQAEQLRNTLAQMSVLRMRKYELKQDNLTLEQMQAIHDDVVSKMQALAETQK